MKTPLIECVPNFSEGRDASVIAQITQAIAAVEGVKVLNVDPGVATNRTVVTFVGAPEAVVEAAFRGIQKAAQVIDMRKHHGEHPRIGATDVCPLIPVSDVTMEETVQYARALAERVGSELNIPVYCYEYAALSPERRNLAVCRAGEYEGLAKKLLDPQWKPDFGPSVFSPTVAASGLTVIGARDFLVAVNFNLNTTSTRRANAVAFDVREKGRKVLKDGKPLLDDQGQECWQPGTLRCCKAIGWYIEEYGIAQVSMNLTDINVTPLHVAFQEVCDKAAARGMRVTGTELVGLVPKRALLDAGIYFLHKQQRSTGIAEDEIIKIAIKSMGLDDLKPFDAHSKVLEYLLEDPAAEARKLVSMTCKAFVQETASESPAPGGGSIAAYMGALAAALGTMVANLSAHKRGWDARWDFFSQWADTGQTHIAQLLHLVDRDTEAFNKIMEALSMPRTGDAQKAARAAALEQATVYATQVPLETMKAAFDCFPLLKTMAMEGNPNSVSDAGVGALAALAAVQGAYLNVCINAAGLKNRQTAEALLEQAASILNQAQICRDEVWAYVTAAIAR